MPVENIGTYADDLVIIAQGEAQLSRVLQRLDDWADENRCEINRTKTQILQIKFRRRKLKDDVPQFGGYQLVDKFKYLGVLLDSSLTMRDYFAALRQKVSRLTSLSYKFQLRECSVKTRYQIY